MDRFTPIKPSSDPELTPSYHGKDCLGNGEHEGIECCCDECDYMMVCFPDYNDPDHLYTYGDKRDFWRPTVREETCLECKHRGKEVPGIYKPWKRKAFCEKTKRVGRDLRGTRCLYFETKDE